MSEEALWWPGTGPETALTERSLGLVSGTGGWDGGRCKFQGEIGVTFLYDVYKCAKALLKDHCMC